jgi:ATP-dependent DNA ligase
VPWERLAIRKLVAYIGAMPALFEFCLTTRKTAVPAGEGRFQEVKYDDYRLRVERDGDRVRLVTKAIMTGPSASRGSSTRR